MPASVEGGADEDPLHAPHQQQMEIQIQIQHQPHSKALSPHPMLPPKAAVPATKIRWEESWPSYSPVHYEAQSMLDNNRDVVPAEQKPHKGWADPPDGVAMLEEILARKSFEGPILLGADGAPVNPRGRTGMKGRGVLGKWGPNHAADPIVTRLHPGRRMVQFVAIQRSDTAEWALPGGMVDPGEAVSTTVRRELMEEAFNIQVARAYHHPPRSIPSRPAMVQHRLPLSNPGLRLP